MAIWFGTGCSAYDSALLPKPELPGSHADSGTSPRGDAAVGDHGDAGGDGGPSSADGGPDAGDGGTACRPNPDSQDEVCTLVCPEACNGEDDDCDRRIDEDDANTACASPHTMAVCEKGACLILDCEGTFRDCNQDPADGCETNVDSDGDNCGQCKTNCVLPNGTAACVSGVCAITACAEGFDDCDSMNLDCETRTNTLRDCGNCGKACAGLDHATPTCASGNCGVASCVGNYGDCDRSGESGCERPLDTATDCGGCDVPCAKRTCAGGYCTDVMCVGTKADCDDTDGVDCEVDLSNDIAHCGGCAIACMFTTATPNAAIACNNKNCVANCSMGFGDCDGDYTTGCERAVNTTANCGSCDFSCSNELQHTSATACNATSLGCEVVTCSQGYGNCDAMHATGCETDFKSTATCGTSCLDKVACVNTNASGSTCPAGKCVFTCDTGYEDCDGDGTTGCEQVDSISDCGCGHVNCDDANVCSTDQCTAGACVHTPANNSAVCRPSLGDCDPLAEQCTVGSTACPADSAAAGGTPCRASTGECDPAETCSGSDPYFQTVAVVNAGAAQTDFQVALAITSSNTSFWTNVANGASATGTDIRVTDSNNVELSFWIEELNTSTKRGKIWVKFPTLAAPAAAPYATLRLYYGNAALPQRSSITSTMLFGDDFSGATIDDARWDSGTTANASDATYFTIGGGELRLTNISSTTSTRLRSNVSMAQPVVMESKWRQTGSMSHDMVLGTRASAADHIGIYDGGIQLYVLTDAVFDGPFGSSISSAMAGKMVATGGAVTVSIKNYGTGANLITPKVESNTVSGRLTLGIAYNDDTSGSPPSTYWDWVFARKYAAAEPTMTLSAVQQATVDPIGTTCPTNAFLANGASCTGGTCSAGVCGP